MQYLKPSLTHQPYLAHCGMEMCNYPPQHDGQDLRELSKMLVYRIPAAVTDTRGVPQ